MTLEPDPRHAQLGDVVREATVRLLKDPRLTHAQVADQVAREATEAAGRLWSPVPLPPLPPTGWAGGFQYGDEPSLS